MAVKKKKTVITIIGLLTMCVFFTLYQVKVLLKSNTHRLLPDSTSSRNTNKTIKAQEKSGMPTHPGSKAPVLVLIQTYMRSGSSLTGDIMQHSPGAFYVYEPLRFLSGKHTLKKFLLYMNSTRREPPISFSKEAADVLYHWFTCDIKRLPAYALLDSFLSKGIKTSKFSRCLGRKESNRKLNRTSMYKCAQQLHDACEDSPIRILKTVRIQLSEIKHLLEALPNLKIIHLVRDPRATLLSQSHFGMCDTKRGGWSGCASRMCSKLEYDILEEGLILKRFPGQLMSVLYENIARHPTETSNELYDFIKAEFTREAENYVYNITMAGKRNNCGICTTRSNSSEHIDTWKRAMQPEIIRIVNEKCNSVLNRYNFDGFQ